MPATIVIAGGLVFLPPWCGRRLPAVGQRVKGKNFRIFDLRSFQQTDSPGFISRYRYLYSNQIIKIGGVK